MSRRKMVEVGDPLVGTVHIAEQIGASSEYARQLMISGAFGPFFDIGRGEKRSRLRVRQSGVNRWLNDRQVPA